VVNSSAFSKLNAMWHDQHMTPNAVHIVYDSLFMSVTKEIVTMHLPIALLLFAIGGILLYFGITASESFSSSVSRLFNGLPTERTQWLMIGGIIALVLGAGVFLYRSRA
jgi:hypothetical protein